MFLSRDGEWLVHDFAQPLANGKHTMPLSLYLKTYFGEGDEVRVERPSKPPAETAPVVDPYEEAEGALQSLSDVLRPYWGHGLHRFDEEAADLFAVSSDTEKLARGTALMVYRSPDGRPWGLQARAERNGKRAYWWHTRPKMPVSFSEGWRDADILVVAEGLPKAVGMAKTVDDYVNRYATFKKETEGKEIPRKRVGYIALGGKSSLPKVMHFIAGFPRYVIILLDNDVEKEVVDPKTKDPVALAVRDIYYGRVSASLKTRLIGQPWGQDINDLLILMSPREAAARLHEVRPRVNETSAARHIIPAVNGLKQSELAVLNAYWMYAIIKDKVFWGKQHGYLADVDPTYVNLMALSGLNMQTIKLAKASLMRKGLISKRKDGSTRLHIRRWRKHFPKYDKPFPEQSTDTVVSDSPTAKGRASSYSTLLFLNSGRSIVVVKLYTSGNRAQARLGRLSLIGGYRKHSYSRFGSTGVKHVLSFMLRWNGLSFAAIGRLLGIDRRTASAAVKRVWHTLRNMAAAFQEYLDRFMEVAYRSIERLIYLQQRAFRFVETGDMEYFDDYRAVLVINRRFARAQIYASQPNVNPYAVGYGG